MGHRCRFAGSLTLLVLFSLALPLPLFAQSSLDFNTTDESVRDYRAAVMARSNARFHHSRGQIALPSAPEQIAEGRCESTECLEPARSTANDRPRLSSVTNLRFSAGIYSDQLASTVAVFWDAPRSDSSGVLRLDHYEVLVINEGRWHHYRVSEQESFGLPRRHRGGVDASGRQLPTRAPHQQQTRPKQSIRLPGLNGGELRVYVRPVFRPGNAANAALAHGALSQALSGNVVSSPTSRAQASSSTKMLLGSLKCDDQVSNSEVKTSNDKCLQPEPEAVVIGDIAFSDMSLASCVNKQYSPSTLIADVSTLSCPGAGIGDLRGLDKMSALVHLDLSGNPVSDLQALTNLIDLQFLSVALSMASDLWPLADLPALRELHLDGTPVKDLLPLSNLGHLHTLFASGSQVTFLPDLSATAIKVLMLDESPVYDISGLANLLSLREFSLLKTTEFGQNLGDLSPLIDNALHSESKLAQVDLFGQNHLYCLQIESLEAKLTENGQPEGLTAPTTCTDLPPVATLTTSVNPAEGNNFVLSWPWLTSLGAVFEIERIGPHSVETYIAEQPQLDFASLPALDFGVYLFRARSCVPAGTDLHQCSGWSSGLEQIVAADPSRPIVEAIADVSDFNLRVCIEDTAGIGTNSPMELAGELTRLVCRNRNIQQLDGLSGFPNLAVLNLNSNSIHSLAPASSLHALTNLNVRFNQVTGDELVHVLNTPDLDLQNNHIDHVDALLGSGPYETLMLSGNQIADLSPLSQVTIWHLRVSDNQLNTLPPLTGVEILALGDNSITDLSALTTISSTLKRIYLENNPLSDGAPGVYGDLSNLNKVWDARLDNTGINNLDFLSNWSALWRFHINDNPISDFTPLSARTGLQALFADRTLMSNLSFVSGATNLLVLYARETEITDLTPLGLTDELHDLRISNGNLSDVSSLDPLSGRMNLATVELADTGVVDVSVLIALSAGHGPRLVRVDLNGESDIPCDQLMVLWQRGVLFAGHGDSRCVPGQIPDFSAQLSSDFETYNLSWSPAPAPQGYLSADHYEIEYRLAGSSTLLGTVTVDGPHAQNAELNLPHPESGHYEFRIRACDEQGRCGDWSDQFAAWYPLVAPSSLVAERLGQQVRLSWEYPFQPPVTAPIQFEVSALFPVVDPIVVAWGDVAGWEVVISNIDQYPGGIVRIRACHVDTENQFCGPSKEIRVVEPVYDINIPAPTSIALDHLGGVNYSLRWDRENHEAIDYYRIEESPDNSAGRVYAVESLEDLPTYRSNYRKRNIEVRACQRVRGAEDRCSDSAALPDAVMGNTVNPFNSSSLYGRNLCWFDGGDLTSGGSANYKLRWTYDSGPNKAPDQFGTRRTTLNAPILKTQEFKNAKPILFDVNSADPDNPLWVWKWGWELEQSGTAGERIKVVPLSHGLSNNQWVRWQPPYSSSGGITPIITQANGEFAWDESSRCPEPIEPQSSGRAAAGGPGALNPGAWITTKPDIEPEHCDVADRPNPVQDPEAWQIWKNCRYTPSVGLGTGWRFYWTNELRIDEVNEAFGVSYDLVAFWHTYKKIRGVWSPVWYYSRMQATGSSDGQYVEGALMYPQAASSDLSVGTVRVYFGSPEDAESGGEARQHAWLNIDMDHDSLVAHEEDIPLRDFVLDGDVFEQNEFLGPRKNHHYRGVWTPQGGGGLFPNEDVGQILEQNDFFVVEWAVGGLSSIGLHGFDDAGEPFWLVNFTCHGGQALSGLCGDEEIPDLGALHELGPEDFVSIHPSINPFYLPEDFHAATAAYGLTEIHKPEDNGSGLTRLYRGTNPDPQMDFLTGSMCIDLSGTLEYENSSFTRTYHFLMGGENCSTYEPIKKIANLHYINFDFSGDAACDLAASEHCQIRLTWFTDDYFPDAMPMYSVGEDLSDLRELGELCAESFDGPFDFLEYDRDCHISAPGQYRFHLVNWPGTSEEAVIASSRSLATGAPSSGPLVPLLPVTQPPSIPGNELSASSMIGSTASEFRVTEGGAASYSIPIATVPGSGGVAPQISLEYNSHQGYGPLGLSWGLAGLSTISRCGQTLVHDGHNTGIQLDSTDRFCLDGQRLIKVSGGGGYGAPGSVYRLEIDNLTRVQAFGERGGSPTHFVVQRSDGSTSIFGSENDTTEDQIIAPTQNIVFAWPMTRFEDSASNFITFEYYQPDPANFIEWLPHNIRYTGNSRADTPTFARLYFDVGLMPAPERSVAFSAGERVQTVHRINKIISFGASNSIHRMYRLGYTHTSGGQSIIDSVQECWSADANACLPATTFSWATGQLTTPDPEQTQLFTPVLHKFRPVFGLSGLFQGIENMQHILFDDRIGAH